MSDSDRKSFRDILAETEPGRLAFDLERILYNYSFEYPISCQETRDAVRLQLRAIADYLERVANQEADERLKKENPWLKDYVAEKVRKA